MNTSARQVGACRACLILWAWWIVFGVGGLSSFAQSAKPAAKAGRAFVQKTGRQTELEVEGPFLQGPTTAEPEPPPLDSELLGPPTDSRIRWNWAPHPDAALPANYWVVSFRECPQWGSPSSADQCTQYHYFGSAGEKGLRPPEDFYASLRPDIPVCMMVHGSLVRWEQMMDEGHQTYEWLKRAAPDTPFQMVFVTWPSERVLLPVPPVDFSLLGRQSSYNGLYLARVLSKVPSEISISLIGHSHGARLVVSSLNLVGGGDVEGFRLSPRQTPWPRLRAVMAAAAVDHHWLDPDQRYGHAFNNTESLLNFRNRDDFALRMYPVRLAVGREALGRVGFSWYDQKVIGENYAKVRDVEVTSVLGLKHIWPWFYNQPLIGEMLTPYLFFQDDLPAKVTLRPETWWPFGPAPRAVAGRPTEANTLPGKAQLVRSTPPQLAPQPKAKEREIAIHGNTGRATVTPSAIRVFGNPASRAPRKNP